MKILWTAIKLFNVKLVLSLIIIFSSLYSNAKTIRVAVVDTGFDFSSDWPNAKEYGLIKPKLCKTGHKDFTNTGLMDTYNHGTHIAGLIAKELKDVDYCLIVIKYWDKNSNGSDIVNTLKSFRWAITQKVDVINYSGGGTEYSEPEKKTVLEAILFHHIIFVAAAGNESSNVKTNPYYPASYSSLIESVGNLEPNGRIAPTSNYGGAITTYKMGTKVLSLFPGNSYGTLTGTSQATAIRTGEIVKELAKKQKLNVVKNPK